MENAEVAYASYLGKAVWPSHLAVMYVHPQRLNLWAVAGAGLPLLAITALVAERRRRYLVVGWLWFLGTLVPMIGLVQVGCQAMADRYAYLPLVGVFIMGVWGAAEWGGRRARVAAWLPEASLAALLALGSVTHRQVGTGETVGRCGRTRRRSRRGTGTRKTTWAACCWRRVAWKLPCRIHYRALAGWPDDPTSNLNVGAYEQRNRNLPDAIEHYKKVLQSAAPEKLKLLAASNLERAYEELGWSDAAGSGKP